MRGLAILILLAAPRLAAAQPGGETEAAATGPSDQPRGWWLEVFGEHYPTRDEQKSIYTGGRLLLRAAGLTRIVLDGGYIAAGAEAGDGDDGLAVGAGVETLLSDRGDWHPFVRLKLDHVVKQTSDRLTGTLETNSGMVSAGVRLRDALDLHVSAGKSYSGDLSLGFGLALGLRL